MKSAQILITFDQAQVRSNHLNQTENMSRLENPVDSELEYSVETSHLLISRLEKIISFWTEKEANYMGRSSVIDIRLSKNNISIIDYLANKNLND